MSKAQEYFAWGQLGQKAAGRVSAAETAVRVEAGRTTSSGDGQPLRAFAAMGMFQPIRRADKGGIS